MSSERTVTRNVVVDATPRLVFQVLTETGNLRDWFCDTAWSDPRPGGRYALHWAQGYHVEGRFLEIDPPRRAVVSWHGTGEPGETRVAFELQEQDGGVNVQVVHSGFGPGSEWDEAEAQARRGWDAGLENLKSTIETGIDLRTARQPFLGIHLDLLTPERAAREDIAAQWGIYIEGVVDGSGAQAAGLGHGEVIVSLGGMPTNSFEELGAALRARQAGDTVEVERVRGQARDTLQVTLGSRPQPELPDSAPALADLICAGGRFTTGHLRANPFDRGRRMAMVVLLVRRANKNIQLPDDHFVLRVGDRVLLAGSPVAKRHLELTLHDSNALHYVVTGQESRGGSLWRWLTRKNPPPIVPLPGPDDDLPPLKRTNVLYEDNSPGK